jgi:hypothetical protein
MDVMRAGILPIPTVDGPTALDMHGKAAAKATNVIMTVRLRAIRGGGAAGVQWTKTVHGFLQQSHVEQ